MMILLVEGKNIQTYLALCGKSISHLLLNRELTIIKHIFWHAKFYFTSHTQAWLLVDMLNQNNSCLVK